MSEDEDAEYTQDYDHLIKLLLIGDSCVGKSKNSISESIYFTNKNSYFSFRYVVVIEKIRLSPDSFF